MYAEADSTFHHLLTDKVSALSQRIEALALTGRKDEADLKKAARNIYGIFLALLEKKAKQDDILRLFTTLPNTWRASRDLAARHGDYAHIAIEDTKLAALDDIAALYARAAEAIQKPCAAGECGVAGNE